MTAITAHDTYANRNRISVKLFVGFSFKYEKLRLISQIPPVLAGQSESACP